jgi:type II secretory pathway pseudopilin PulG
MKRNSSRTRGYSLVELMIGTIIFTIITGAIFGLLTSAQLQYQGENGLSTVFQQGNVAVDQIVRDVHSAGYPGRSAFAVGVANAHPENYSCAFAWSPNYPDPVNYCASVTACTVSATCTAPSATELILEADTRSGGGGVQWIRYSLQGTTLMRGVVPKAPFADPIAATAGQLVPYLENVQNGDVPVFTYCYGTGCSDTITPRQPSNIREVNITLQLRSTSKDPQTQQYRTVTVNGQAVRFNPNQ